MPLRIDGRGENRHDVIPGEKILAIGTQFDSAAGRGLPAEGIRHRIELNSNRGHIDRDEVIACRTAQVGRWSWGRLHRGRWSRPGSF